MARRPDHAFTLIELIVVIRDGLRALDARDAAVERWLRNEVVGALDAVADDPSKARTSDDVRAALRDAAQRRATA